MKEIKLKAFHKGRKETYKVYGLTDDSVFKDSPDGLGADGVPDDRKDVVLKLFTGFKDSEGNEIYDGDKLSEEVETDEGIITSVQQVYWCDEWGAWFIDESFVQDCSIGSFLAKSLAEYKYKLVTNNQI